MNPPKREHPSNFAFAREGRAPDLREVLQVPLQLRPDLLLPVNLLLILKVEAQGIAVVVQAQHPRLSGWESCESHRWWLQAQWHSWGSPAILLERPPGSPSQCQCQWRRVWQSQPAGGCEEHSRGGKPASPHSLHLMTSWIGWWQGRQAKNNILTGSSTGHRLTEPHSRYLHYKRQGLQQSKPLQKETSRLNHRRGWFCARAGLTRPTLGPD